MKDLTPMLLGAGLVYFLLQAQKTQKGGDTFVDRRSAPGGAETRTGRIVDNAQKLVEDTRNWGCDNLPWVPWDCSA